MVALSARARGVLKLAALIGLLVVAAIVLRASPARDLLTPQGVGRLIERLRGSWWAPFVFVVAYVAACGLAFSGTLLTLAGGAVFGFWWGALLNTIGANLGAWAAFWLARVLGREGLKGLLGRRLAGLDRVAQQSGFAWLTRLRLIPIVPFNLLNFASGLTALPWRTYAAATAVGILPGTLVYTFFADALLSGGREASQQAFVRVLIAGALLVLLGFVPTVARKLGWVALVTLALSPGSARAQGLVDHAAFTAILRDHVRGALVDYAGLERDSTRLGAYLDRLAAVDSLTLAAANHDTRLALWINAYNACMLQRVIAHYPIKKAGFPRSLRNTVAGRPANSVWQIQDPFTRRHCRVAGALRSQDDIEHGIIRPMGDPRIHFAVNCASRSCPVLAAEAYVPEHVDEQLDAAVRRFVADTSQFSLREGPPSVLTVNKVLDWYGEDFGGPEGVKRFFARYAELPRDMALRFFDYDWALNDLGDQALRPP
ncbi:MAG: VTT domain-containing protein [Gemmatimonadales bacterium]